MIPSEIQSAMSARRLEPREGLRDLRGEVDVELRETTCIVRRQRHPHLAPPDVEVGVMVGGLGEEPDAHDERDRVGEGRALELPARSRLRSAPSPAARRVRSRSRRRTSGAGRAMPSIEQPDGRCVRLAPCPWTCPRNRHRPAVDLDRKVGPDGALGRRDRDRLRSGGAARQLSVRGVPRRARAGRTGVAADGRTAAARSDRRRARRARGASRCAGTTGTRPASTRGGSCATGPKTRPKE